MRRNARWAALGAGLLLTTGLTACDGGGGADAEDDPAAALSDAIGALEDYDGVELTLSIDGDRDTIIASSGGDIDDDAADLLLTSSVTVRAAGEDESDAQAELLVTLGDQRALEVRVLPEQQFFLRVDLDAVGSALDDPSFAAGIDDAVDTAEMFGLGELAAAIRSGDWIQLTGIEQLAEFAGGAADGGTDGTDDDVSEEEVEDVQERIVASFQRFVDQDVEVTYVGEESEGERVRATTTQGDLARLLDEITTIASELSGVDPEAFAAELTDDAAGSDRPVQLDFWLDGGELRQIGYDLSQVEGEDSAPEGTYVLVTLDEFSGSVEAPSESTEVDVFAILGNLFGGFGGLGGEGPAGDGTDAFADDGDDAFEDDGAADGGDPLGGGCITEEQIDQLTGGDPAARSELEAAVEAGLIEIC